MSIETGITRTEEGMGQGRWLALGALVLSGLVIGLDGTVLVTAIPTLSANLGASTSELQWIMDAYTLALGALLLPAGVLGDHFGRKRLLVVGLLLFGASSLLASQMTTAAGLIAMRAVMGAGAALIMPLSLSILPSMFSERERPRAVAVLTAGVMLGMPFGPLVAGWLLTHFAWGSVFLINGPVVVLAVLGVGFLIPESRDPDAPRLDWLGAALAAVAVTGIVYGIIEQPIDGWTGPRVLAGLAGGAAVLAAFVVRELTARSPLFDMRLFLNPRFTWSTMGFVVIGFGMFGVLFILSPYLQVVQGADAQGTGVRLLPLIAALIVAALASDRLTARLGTRFMVAGGLVVTAAGMVLLSRAGADTGYGLVAASLSIMGLGMGLAMPPAVDAILGAVPAGQAGVGMALQRTLQQVAASLGVAVLGSILSGAYRSDLGGHVAGLPARAREVAEGSVAGAAVVAQHLPAPLGRPLMSAAGHAYAQGMSSVMLVSAAVVLAGALLVALFLPSHAAAAEDRDTTGREARPQARRPA
jgi:DHA2 family multidrug resistance protein-like MFS transporter